MVKFTIDTLDFLAVFTQQILKSSGSGAQSLWDLRIVPSTDGISSSLQFRLSNANTGSNISNAGNGYISDPELKLGSQVHNEIRAKDVRDILILYLNHKEDRSETLDENRPFELKAPFDTTARLYDQNGTLAHFGSTEIQNMNTTSINRYNVNSFVHTD